MAYICLTVRYTYRTGMN